MRGRDFHEWRKLSGSSLIELFGVKKNKQTKKTMDLKKLGVKTVAFLCSRMTQKLTVGKCDLCSLGSVTVNILLNINICGLIKHVYD